MHATPQQLLADLRSDERSRQDAAYSGLIEATQDPVPWSYEIWDDLVAMLSDRSNRRRAIASQVLCNLARSDPEERIVHDFDALLEVTRDERFVTARHCLQSLWKVGAAGPHQRELFLRGMETRFRECVEEKNCTLIRFDIMTCMRRLYDLQPDPAIHEVALELIDEEADTKYRRKYLGVWKDVEPT